MKRKSKNNTGQLSIFDQIVYAGRSYNDLKKAMIEAMQDFYLRNKYPRKIITPSKVYDFQAIKDYWNRYELYDIYVC